MNYGFHLATGGVLASMRRMDTIANNLANANTTGFKPDFLVQRERYAARIDGSSPLLDPTAPPREMLERLGGGVRFEPDRIDLTQGPIERTLGKTDFALVGEGFFALAGADDAPPRAGAPVDLSRDGALMVDGRGTLRRVSDGRAILSDAGRPIRVDPTAEFSVDEAGRVMQSGAEIARMHIVRPTDPTALRKLGGNVLQAAAVERVPSDAVVVQAGALERSNADPVRSMIEMLRQSRLLEANLRMLQYQDSLTGQAITGITRLA
jgi:flagellar basal body rod protein FlgG